MHSYKITTLIAVSSLLGGCASLPEMPTIAPMGSGKINIISTPAGANAFASGKPIGKTPLYIAPDSAFPPHWQGTSYLVDGILKLEKEGCEPYEMKVNDPVLSKDIKVSLKCDENYQPAPKLSNKPLNTESRLDEIDALLKKGKISEEEYKSIRQRILNTL